ncbi:MAG: short-chain fatty acid transporter [Actinobacteria bacterium]|nr:short-chain fatty acid transporter [Actinomycetota bacterium]
MSENTPIAESEAPPESEAPREGGLARLGLSIADWSERWFPDAFVFALVGIVVVFIGGLLLGESPQKLAIEGGKGFWVLIPFTMQMAMIIIGGYVVASSPFVYGLIQRLAALPKTPRSAIAFVCFFAMVTSLISWGFSLIFSGLLIREICRRIPGIDFRAIGAAGFMGLGSIWALGLSSSAALMMATKGSIPPALFSISGVIALTKTIFLWQGIATAAILLVVSVAIAFWSAPSPARAKTAESYGLHFEPLNMKIEPRTRPGEWLEYSPLLSILVSLLLIVYLWDVFKTSPAGPLEALNLNTYNLIFIVLGLLLHWRPKRFLRAVADSVPAVGGVLIQFPFYAAIFGMITGTGISAWMAKLFVDITTRQTYPLLVAAYSAVLGLFVPSGGSKWVIEAPYVLQAAIAHQVNLGWVVQIYNMAEALPNMINPFWMLPLLGLLSVKARELVGFSILQLLVHVPLVLFLCWFFTHTLTYVAPVK